MCAYETRIHERRIVEAFPNLFLGSLLDGPKYPANALKKRKWTDTLFPLVRERLRELVLNLLPGRGLESSFDLDDHEEIAALTCATTALCVAGGSYTAVGSASQGFIVLPPRRFLGAGWQEVLTTNVARVRVNFPDARVVWADNSTAETSALAS
jgi:hypothetical protein